MNSNKVWAVGTKPIFALFTFVPKTYKISSWIVNDIEQVYGDTMKKREYKDKIKYKSRIRKQYTAATKSDALRSKEDVEISDEMINRMKHQISA